MGTFCSTTGNEDDDQDQQEKPLEGHKSRLHKRVQRGRKSNSMDHPCPTEPEVRLDVVNHRKEKTRLDVTAPNKPLEYGADVAVAVSVFAKDRDEIVERGRQLSFKYSVTERATPEEKAARDMLQKVRKNDELAIYRKAPNLLGYGSQQHPRFSGDHFLSNAALIEKTALFKIAQYMPKGGHLHIHFNSCLLPNFLLDIAAKQPHMYVWSNRPLVSAENLDQCEIQFSIKSREKLEAERRFLGIPTEPFYTDLRNLTALDERVNLLSAKYLIAEDATHTTRGQAMNYDHLRRCWNEERRKWRQSGDMKRFDIDLQEWLINKLVFNEQEAHNAHQSPAGAWEKFNGRTRMMKGLFNYESAYREYTRNCLQHFVANNIQYAEIRPNFMKTNYILTDDGIEPAGHPARDNRYIMGLIQEECERFMEELGDKHTFLGIKVIYCTPRSFTREAVAASLDECLQFKKEWPDYIAGFDLVGEEDVPRWPLSFFTKELLEFQAKCRKEGVEIPFLFHCGETLEIEGQTDGNLVDALLLGSKRIGHGFSLARHPYLISQFKKRNICLEICPISNEVLGLTPRINGHAMYSLLANDIHCTVNSDNATLYKSTLSHDFYQVMVGSNGMDLLGWKQLILWSIEHASMSEEERAKLAQMWQRQWVKFIDQINSLDVLEDEKMPEYEEDKVEQQGPTRPGDNGNQAEWEAYIQKITARLEKA